MTEERKTTDPGAADDSQVSKTYRELAQETTPEYLDAAVLREARKAAQPRYSRLRLWTRPAAWAAIVLISGTLLLQVSQFQPPQESPMAQSPGPGERATQRELAEPEGIGSDKRADDSRPGTAGAADETAVEELVIESLESASRDADMFRRAEDMARMQQGPNEAPAERRPELRQAISATASRVSAPACDDAARAAPETWLACILALEEAGMEEAAGRERTLLDETFPDFEAP